MDKEDVVHIYTGILLSHKKERNWVICRDVDGSRDCHTEWSKSERGKQISYINTYMWNLEKWYRWTSLQGRNRDTDVENECMDTKGGMVGVVGWTGRLGYGWVLGNLCAVMSGVGEVIVEDLDMQREKVCIWCSRKSRTYIWGFGKESVLGKSGRIWTVADMEMKSKVWIQEPS